MGERDTAWQKPGYNGLCNYAQKITSCFGLDGKTGRGRGRVEGCVCVYVRACGAGCRNSCEMFWNLFCVALRVSVCVMLILQCMQPAPLFPGTFLC